MNLRLFQIIRNMGLRYALFQIRYALQRYSGWLILKFPRHHNERNYISLDDWRKLPVQYVFNNEFERRAYAYCPDNLKARVERIKGGQMRYFSAEWIPFSDWHTNPKTGYRYNSTVHWSRIKTMDPKAGDIKYVWEISRFTFLYDLIRYDFYSGMDQSEWVFDKIENWIDYNPVNCGPNWVCSQEISLRVINWTFALHYYKHSDQLTESRFDKIMHSIRQQIQHVADNISFSAIAVRNNHILTESLGLYLTGLLYPFFPERDEWKKKGRAVFEREIAHQIDENGAYIQFSFNYHRVAVQLLTLAIRLAELNQESWSDTIYQKAKASVLFLKAFQDQNTGWLSNFGNNDGALFFPLTECHFRDYRPQLEALAGLLEIESGYGVGAWNEESFWIGNPDLPKVRSIPVAATGPLSLSGYHILRDGTTRTFIRSANYRHRPFQCDNLHLDIWVDGENILRDAGTYSYNSNDTDNQFFPGTKSHNTVMPGNYDQMLKGPGFIWYNWIGKGEGRWREGHEDFEFEGWFEGFWKLGKHIRHQRRVVKKKGEFYWLVEDRMENVPGELYMNQIWNPSQVFFEKFKITACDADQVSLMPEIVSGWYAESYGKKEETKQIIFRTKGRFIRTIIEPKLST